MSFGAATLGALRRLLFFSAPEAARWVARDAARPQGVEERTWNRWEAGKLPVPDNIAAAVLRLVAWREKALQAAQDTLAQEAFIAVPWYAEADDWPGPPALWRPAQSVAAALLAEHGMHLVRLAAFDALAFHAWRRERGRPDDEAARAAWAAEVAPVLDAGFDWAEMPPHGGAPAV